MKRPTFGEALLALEIRNLQQGITTHRERGKPLLWVSGEKGNLTYELELPTFSKLGTPTAIIKLTKHQVKTLGLKS